MSRKITFLSVVLSLISSSLVFAAEPAGRKAPRYGTVAGVVVEIDGETGRLRPLSLEERKAVLKGLDKMLTRSSAGLKTVTTSGGEVTMALDDRFSFAYIAYFDTNGQKHTACVDDLDAALALLFPPDGVVAGQATE